MVRITTEQQFVSGKKYAEMNCLSTDTKPVEVGGCGLITGSIAFEVDTQDVYFFDEDAASGEEWIKAGGE